MKRISFSMQCAWRLLGGALLTLTLTQCSNDDGPDVNAANLTVSAAENVTRTSADISGIISIKGAVSECGFLYSMAQSDLSSSSGNAMKKSVSATSGRVTAHLDGLTPGATYYYCLYASSGKSRAISNILNFTTESQDLPVLNKVEVLEVTEYTLKLRCSIAGDGGATLQEYGFEYRKKAESTWTAVHAKGFDEGSSTVFTLTIENLDPRTDYVVRGVAKNSVGNAYSEEVECKTESVTSPVVTLYVDECAFGSDYVKAFAKIESHGASDEILERGFCWSTSNENPLVTDNKQEASSTDDTFSATITGLTQGTKYHVRAYASNKVDGKTLYGYSKEVAVITTAAEKRPVLGEVTVEATESTAALSCHLTDAGNTAITERGFCWSKTSTTPTTADNVAKVETEDAEFRANLEDLDESSTYYVCAYVKTVSAGKEAVTYSAVATFQTAGYERPTFANIAATDVSFTTARLSATINPGGVAIKEKGFCYSSVNAVPTVADSKSAATGNALEVSLTNLQAGTLYHYCAYAVYTAGSKEETLYSDVSEFTTSAYTLPTLTQSEPTNVTATSAQLSASITSMGDGTLQEYGFVWYAGKQTPAVEEGKHDGIAKIADNADFRYSMTGLVSGATYYVRAYVKVKVGDTTEVVYSAEQSFTTTQLTKATVDVPTASNVGDSSFTVTAQLTDAGDTEITEVGFCWTTDKNASADTLEKHRTTLGSDNSFTLDATGLTAGATYYVRAYAENSAGTAYSAAVEVSLQKVPGKGDIVSPDK